MVENSKHDSEYCHRRAEANRRVAAQQTDPKAAETFTDLQNRWTRLAKSYEFTERIDHVVEPKE